MAEFSNLQSQKVHGSTALAVKWMADILLISLYFYMIQHFIFTCIVDMPHDLSLIIKIFTVVLFNKNKNIELLLWSSFLLGGIYVTFMEEVSGVSAL